MGLETNKRMSLRDNIFITKQLRINSYRQKMAVSVIVDLSGAPHGSYCTFSDTLGNSINRPRPSPIPNEEKGREPRIDVDAPFFRSSGYVKARVENCKRIRLEWRLPSARKVESYPEIRVWVSVPRETATFAASLGECIISRHGNALGPEIDVESLK